TTKDAHVLELGGQRWRLPRASVRQFLNVLEWATKRRKRRQTMIPDNKFFHEERLRAAMDKQNIDVLILRGGENSKYVSGFFHNGGHLAYRPFCVFYFRDPAKEPAFVVPAVDLHLAIDSTWI